MLARYYKLAQTRDVEEAVIGSLQTVGPTVLGFVARHDNEGPQTAAMLEALDGVRVRVYRVGPEAEQVQLHQALNSSVRRLSDGDWQVAMRPEGVS